MLNYFDGNRSRSEAIVRTKAEETKKFGTRKTHMLPVILSLIILTALILIGMFG